jgi:hypothetical protein
MWGFSTTFTCAVGNKIVFSVEIIVFWTYIR